MIPDGDPGALPAPSALLHDPNAVVSPVTPHPIDQEDSKSSGAEQSRSVMDQRGSLGKSNVS